MLGKQTIRKVRRFFSTVLRGRPTGIRARFFRTHWARDPAPVAPAPSSASSPGFFFALDAAELQPGQVGEFLVNGAVVAVANVGGTYYAVSNTCPHAGGPVGDGELHQEVLTCPLHGWSFDVRDGSCKVDPAMALETYDVEVLDGKVYVRIAA